jgi:uncharacterized protein with HEPN domain
MFHESFNRHSGTRSACRLAPQRPRRSLCAKCSARADAAEGAVERNLQIIGEAAKQLPVEVTDAHTGIAWPQIRGFSTIDAHPYFRLDVATLSDVVETHLPPLAAAWRTSNRNQA